MPSNSLPDADLNLPEMKTKSPSCLAEGVHMYGYADSRGFDPHVRQHSFVEIGHEIISTAILSLSLIQEGQLSVTGERMLTKCWWTA